jgi:hypothetical protein
MVIKNCKEGKDYNCYLFEPFQDKIVRCYYSGDDKKYCIWKQNWDFKSASYKNEIYVFNPKIRRFSTDVFLKHFQDERINGKI